MSETVLPRVRLGSTVLVVNWHTAALGHVLRMTASSDITLSASDLATLRTYPHWVALSGGVDSTTAAALTMGQDTVGVTLLLWGKPAHASSCSTADASAAAAAATQLGIPHVVIDATEAFSSTVVAEYVEGVEQGRRPNPCVTCNKVFKLEYLTELARSLGAHRVTTGHYAQIINGSLARATDTRKDQSYVLATATPDQLKMLDFPLGRYSKDQVRLIAQTWDLPQADVPESMDLCIDVTGLVSSTPATLVDVESGCAVGTHPAWQRLTVGQRRGLGVGGSKRYVTGIDPASNTVFLGSPAVASTRFTSTRWHGVTGRLLVQTSAHGTPRLATVSEIGVEWDETHELVSPGQVMVAYDENTVVGYGYAQ